MSKAFTKENDGAEDEGIVRVDELPLTAKNYVTPRGLRMLQAEQQRLAETERPETVRLLNEATAASMELEIAPLKKRLRDIDARLHYLGQRIQMAQVIDPGAKRARADQVFFGATVTFSNRLGEKRTVRIVGVDEMDVAKGDISFVSPLAKALLRAEEGDVVPFDAPGGRDELEVVEVRYLADGEGDAR
ncbi:transcription elongation factor GreB [Bryobacterales bacterium F-183]|nr:transcription elongation factor GreB [Bryobacterales bacterium F-183]